MKGVWIEKREREVHAVTLRDKQIDIYERRERERERERERRRYTNMGRKTELS